ncbi:MAG: HSP20 family protein, partial [bacterium]
MRRNNLTLTNNQEPKFGVDRLHNEINNMFNSLTDQPLYSPFFNPLLTAANERNVLAPSMDLTETDKNYEICAELPGLNIDDVKITYDEGVLTLSGKKEARKEDQNKDFHIIERSFGKFRRQVKLPTNVDDNKIEAKFHNGI